MPIPGNFLGRFAISLITASLLFDTDLGPQQVMLYDRILRKADEVLSVALKQGDGNSPEVFDYIVVGGGSAGAVVANRLSASGNFSVLLLEAGGDPNPISDIPFARRHIWEHSSLVKYYKSVPQNNACLANGVCDHPRAISLGGCSVLNEVLYNRCNKNDYDLWAKFTKDPRWSWNNVLKAYKQIEDYHGYHEGYPGPSHGLNGEVYVGTIDHIPGVDFLLDAFAEEGIPVGGDLTSGLFPYGYTKIDYSIKKGLRQSSFHAFLLPILGERDNLNVYRYSWATKIVLDDETKRAVGVQYKRHGKMGYAEARKEVVVCAGAFETPKLLMLSGIGPKDHLEKIGIDVIVDAPSVGNYLQDHVALIGKLHPFSINVTLDSPIFFTNESLAQYLNNGTGPLNLFEYGPFFAPRLAMGYVTSRLGDFNWPDIQTYVHEDPVRKEGNDSQVQQTIFIDHVLMRPHSFGSIRLASINPEDDPLIDPKFFEKGNDMERLIDGIEFTSKLMLESKVFQSVGVKWSDEIVVTPKCKSLKFASREYWRCFVRETSINHYHPSSSCRMGPNKEVAALDSSLRVFGTRGLRVIDASSFPFVPSGNTHFPAMMVGHVGAEMVLKEV